MRTILLIVVCILFSNYSFGQDSTFTYKKDQFDIREVYRFHPNGKPKEIYYSTSSKRPVYEFSREDLFQRNIKYNPNDSTLIDGTIQDSIAYCRCDGRVDSKEYIRNDNGYEFNYYAHYVYDENKLLVRIDTQYLELPREIPFSNNALTLKSRPDKNIRIDAKLPITKVGQNVKIPLIFNSELDEAITINQSYYSKDLTISDTYFELEPNQDGKIFLNFFVDGTNRMYRINIKIRSYKETYNIDLTYHITGFHFSEDYLKEAVGITHSNNRELVLNFENNNERTINIYKDKEVVLSKKSTKAYTRLYISKLEKGDYSLEIINEETNEKIKPILILK